MNRFIIEVKELFKQVRCGYQRQKDHEDWLDKAYPFLSVELANYTPEECLHAVYTLSPPIRGEFLHRFA